MTIKKRPLKPFVEEWGTTRYYHFILFLLSLIIGLLLLFVVSDFSGALVLCFSMFFFGSYIAYEDVYHTLKKQKICPYYLQCSEFRVHYLAPCVWQYENCNHYILQKQMETKNNGISKRS